MNDSATGLLVNQLQNHEENTLWIADENSLGVTSSIPPRPTLWVVSNRFDVYSQASDRGHQAQFSDYDFSAIADNSLDTIVYRVSKERAVVHHIANQARRLLKPGGKLFLAGEKNDGIKGYADKVGKLLGTKTSAKKQGLCYVAEICKNDAPNEGLKQTTLDDKHYSELRQLDELTSSQGSKIAWWSKPGQFGWNKKDQGSDLLISQAETLFSQKSFPSNLVDLGCGYGFLTLMTRDWPVKERYATDNNAAAIASARKNFATANLDVTLTADDCGNAITEKFDGLLCNPPFHQGFANDSSLTHKFLSNAARLLSTTGVALFVVNQFIPLEKLATAYFAQSERLVDDGQFKVIALRH